MAITKLQPFNLDTTANYTFANITATNANLGNAATANYFIGSGANLTSLPAGNISGQVANSAVAGTVYTAAQPNITSVGTLTGLVSNGVVNFANTSNTTLGAVANLHISGGTNAYVLSTDGSGNLSWVAQTGGGGGGSSISNGNSNVNIPAANGNINFTAVGNTTMVVTGTGANIAGTANVTGNVIANNFIAGNGSGGNISNANVISANTITASGNLNGADLSLSGNGVFGGNLTVNGTLTYINSTSLSISDPIINLQTGANGAAPTSNSGKDVGTALNYYDTSAKIAWMGWDVSNAEIAFGSNVGISSEVVTFTSLANIRSGNASLGNAASANYFVGNFYGTANSATTAGTVTTAAQGNITSVGTLTGLTSTGTIDLTGASNTSLGPVANVHISGGTNAYVLSTDGAGNLSWVAQTGGGGGSNISNGNSNVNIPSANGNINFTAVGNTTMVITGTGTNVAGTVNATGNITANNFVAGNGSGGNISNANVISANTFVGVTYNKVTITQPATSATLTLANGSSLITNGAFSTTLTSTATTDATIPSGTVKLGYLNVPQSASDKTSSYTLATSDVGKFIGIGTGGSIVIPDATFSTGDALSIFNNTSANATITCTITTAYISGTDTDKATVTLATRGVATILFISSTVCVIAGSVS